jgi:hypothetical protein
MNLAVVIFEVVTLELVILEWIAPLRGATS